jgi:branched-chain amino acid transport system ATP-binding protein
MLEVADLTIRYGPFLAVDDVSMRVGAGEIVAVVGPNGAGKSSIVKAIGGLVPPLAGRIAFKGQDLLALAAHARVGLGLSIVPEGRGLFPGMSVQENLIIAGDPLNDRARVAANMARGFELFPILAQRRWQAAGTLSGGQQQMLAVAMGLMPDPQLLVLDEPSLGLAPVVIGEIGRALKALRETGLTIMLFEQNAKLTCSVADHIYLLASGTIQRHETAAELLADQSALELLM